MAQSGKRTRGAGAAVAPADPKARLVIITGLSGSGKGTVLRALEDLGYYSVDNLPIDLLPKFAELTGEARNIERAALVVDVREGQGLSRFPEILANLRRQVAVTLVFLDATDEALMRRYSETRRPHPLGTDQPVPNSIEAERKQLQPIREVADHIIDTSRFNVHELRDLVKRKFSGEEEQGTLLINVVSFGFRNGVPTDADLVFDVRFLPNPNYIPKFKELTGKHPGVARYVRSFPQTREFIDRISKLLVYLLPHYIHEGKSYLTIAFGCTGGQHRSVMMAADMAKLLRKAGYTVKQTHRDVPKH